MKNLTRSIVILVGAGCFAIIGFNGAANAQAKKSAKSTAAAKAPQKATGKLQPKQAAKLPEKQISKSNAKPQSRMPVGTLSAAAKQKTPAKTSDKPKAVLKTKPAADKSNATASKNSPVSKEKTVKEKDGKQKITLKTALNVEKTAPKVSAKSNTGTKPATKIIAKTARKTAAATVNSASQQIIVATTSARMRSEPGIDAATVSTVNIGQILTVVEEKPAWIKVQLSNDKSGWISKSIVSNFSEEKRAGIYRTIVDKYFKSDKLNFADAAQIFEFLKNAAAQVKNTGEQADLSFKRLLSLKSALDAVPFGKGGQSPYKDFLDANAGEIVYSEPSAEWLVRSDLVWETHALYKDFPVGEEIAWMGARNPLPGECEGYVNCYLYLLRVTEGEYLNFYPGGKYSKKALQNITATLEPITADLKNKSIYTAATDISDRAEFNRLLTELRTIISKVPHVEKARTINQINQIGEGFR